MNLPLNLTVAKPLHTRAQHKKRNITLVDIKAPEKDISPILQGARAVGNNTRLDRAVPLIFQIKIYQTCIFNKVINSAVVISYSCGVPPGLLG